MQRRQTHHHRARSEVEDALDRELEETFPGSDPLKITRSTPDTQITPRGDLRARPLTAVYSPARLAGRKRRD